MSESGTAWKVVNLDMDHSPFLSAPDKLADIVEGEILEFAASFESTKGGPNLNASSSS